jgi:predicted permease
MSHFLYLQKKAWTGLKKRPGFIATIVATLGITLGALLCILTLAYVLIIHPLPYSKQENLYRLDSVFVKGKDEVLGNFFTYPGVIDLYKNQKLFNETAVIFYANDKVELGAIQPIILSTYVTPEWFTLLDAKMAKGRALESSEALDTNNPVAVLSYKAWQELFSGDPDILDKKIIISDQSFSVVGVLAESFIEPRLRNDGQKTDVFLPWDFNHIRAERGQAWDSPHPDIAFFGNLSSALTVHQIEETLTATTNEAWQEKVKGIGFFNDFHIEMKLRSLKSVILGESEKVVYLLLAAVGGLTLIAFANISNIFMSRTAEQQRQLSIQAALGATKKQLFNAMIAETGQLMMMSIVLALVIANLGFLILQNYFALKLPRVEELSINGFTLGSAVLIVVILAFLFARLSSGMINYKALQSSLHSSGKGSGIQVSKKIRKILIASQVAIVSVLIFINFSIFREGLNIINQPIGFETDNTYLVSLSSWSESAEGIIPTVNEITKKLEELPQVQAVSQAYSPLGLFDFFSLSTSTDSEGLMVQALPVDNKYFDLVGQELLEGDVFSEADINNFNKVIIINDVYARQLVTNGSALGTQLRFGDDNTLFTVIGIVKGIKIPGEMDIPVQAYYLFPPEKYRLKLLLKLKNESVITEEQLTAVINEVGGQVGFWSIESLDARRNELLFTQFTAAITSSVLVVVSYLLAAIGLYGVLSYGTQLRRFELGTRMAIGARRKDIIGLIVKDNLNSLTMGFAASVVMLLILFLGFSSQFKHYLDLQLVSIFAVTLILVSSIAIFACYWPLRTYINQPVIRSLRVSE